MNKQRYEELKKEFDLIDEVIEVAENQLADCRNDWGWAENWLTDKNLDDEKLGHAERNLDKAKDGLRRMGISNKEMGFE